MLASVAAVLLALPATGCGGLSRKLSPAEVAAIDALADGAAALLRAARAPSAAACKPGDDPLSRRDSALLFRGGFAFPSARHLFLDCGGELLLAEIGPAAAPQHGTASIAGGRLSLTLSAHDQALGDLLPRLDRAAIARLLEAFHPGAPPAQPAPAPAADAQTAEREILEAVPALLGSARGGTVQWAAQAIDCEKEFRALVPGLPRALFADYRARNAAAAPLLVPGFLPAAAEPTPYELRLSLSRPGISKDRSWALIYVGWQAGPLAGDGRVWILRRSAAGWRVAFEQMLWMS